ncbi:MAG: MoaD family protein [Armatimonadetes bacterium]|nr:MoaD family protein [Armatimonadota bacterium]
MTIKLNLFASLRQIAGQKQLEIEAGEGATAQDVLKQFAERFKEARKYIFNTEGRILTSTIILINDDTVNADQPVALKNGDELSVLLPTAGG